MRDVRKVATVAGLLEESTENSDLHHGMLMLSTIVWRDYFITDVLHHALEIYNALS